MEKRTPHCSLEKVRNLIGKGMVRITKSAHRDAELIHFGLADMYRVVCELSPQDFYKSMTTYDDHRSGRMFTIAIWTRCLSI